MHICGTNVCQYGNPARGMKIRLSELVVDIILFLQRITFHDLFFAQILGDYVFSEESHSLTGSVHTTIFSCSEQ